MSERYLAWLWDNRFSVLLLAVLTVGAGWFAYDRLAESIFPDVAFPKVVVLVADGRTPVKLMLLDVTKPLEQAAEGEPGVRVVRSQTGVGLSKLHVYFNSGVDPQLAYLLLQARLAHVTLPSGASLVAQLETPEVYPFAEYALVSNVFDSARLQPIFAFQMRPALAAVRGVYQTTATGRGWPEIRVTLSQRRLAEHGLRAEAVVAALKAAQGPYFSGVLDQFHQQYVVATTPRPTSLAKLASLTLPLGPRGADGARQPIALGALGAVALADPPLMTEAAVPGYKHALIVDVQAQLGANQIAVGRAVRAHIAALRRSLPPGVRLIKIYDLSRLITSSLRDVWTALILGSVVAWLVVLAFLRQFTAALATLLVAPLAIGGALLALWMFGLGLNVMTLGGLAAAVGALIDHAIVVMERGARVSGRDAASRRGAAIRATSSILLPMTLATLASCLVFAPLVALGGAIGLLFREMAIAIVAALIASQIVALVVTPIVAVGLAARRAPLRARASDGRLGRLYLRSLVAGMRRPWFALAIAAVLAAAGLAGYARLQTAFLPRWDEGVIAVPYRTPVGSSVAETTRVGRDLMAKALANPAVARASLVVGRSFAYSHATPNKGALTIVLKHARKAGASAVMARLRAAFLSVDPALVALGDAQVMVNRFGDLSGSHAPLEVYVFGPSQKALNKAGAKLARAFRASSRFQSVNFKSPSAGPELDVAPRAVAALYGISAADMSQTLRLRLWGERAGFLLKGEQILPIRVVTGKDPPAFGALANLPIRLSKKDYAPLSELGRLGLRAAEPFATHQNFVPDAYLWLQPAPGEGLSSAARRARAIIAAAHLPKDLSVVLGGYYREQRTSFQQMALILGGALLVLLAFLGFQFGAQRMAVAAVASLAFAAPGSVLALLVTGRRLDSTAFLGLLLVLAIAVNNVILIFATRSGRAARREGPALIALSARRRLRPILMTMAADIAGFLPLAIGVGRGAALLQPLAIAVMGGLAFAIFASLWLAPIFYAVLWRRRAPAAV